MLYELAEKAFRLEQEGKKIIKLNIGDTNLPVPQKAKDAAVECIGSCKPGYGPSAGLPELRKLAAEREGCEPENIVIGPGSKHLIYGLLSVLCSKGDKVSFPSPHWPAYALACKQLGLEACMEKTSLENNWALGEIEPKGKMLIICNPLNPASTIYDENDVKKLVEKAADAGTHVMVDEAYKGLAFKEIPKYDAIRIRSFSKEFSMEGWRLGYALVPEEIAKKLTKFNQITCTCVPEFVQKAGIACLENENEILEEARRLWRSRMDAAQKVLSSNGFRFAKPEAGIYLFATHEGITDSGSFALSLLDKGVAVAPGISFGDYPEFIRICANQPEEVLIEAAEKMAENLR
jgi:aspartate aminotransferase